MRKAKQITFLGLMLAVIITLTAIEQTLPPLPLLPPNVRLGLSNIVTMYCALFVSRTSAVTLNILKSLFALLTRGHMAGLLSLCGGLLSICLIILLAAVFGDKISYAAVSVAGALAHNMGQYAAVSVLLAAPFVYYLPILIVSGTVMGLVTGTLLKVLLPVLHKFR